MQEITKSKSENSNSAATIIKWGIIAGCVQLQVSNVS